MFAFDAAPAGRISKTAARMEADTAGVFRPAGAGAGLELPVGVPGGVPFSPLPPPWFAEATLGQEQWMPHRSFAQTQMQAGTLLDRLGSFCLADALGILGHPVLQNNLEDMRAKHLDGKVRLSHQVFGDVVCRCDFDTHLEAHFSAGRLVDGRKKFIEMKNNEHVKAIFGHVGEVYNNQALIGIGSYPTQIAPILCFAFTMGETA